MAATFDLTNPHVIRTDDEYEIVVQEIDRLLDRDPEPGSQEAERLELLSVLVEAFDRDHFPMGSNSSPQSVVQFVLEQQGRTRGDLKAIFGSKSRVSEFFAGKRKLSINQISALRREFRIPADALIEGETLDPAATPPGAAARIASASAVASDPLTKLIAAQQNFIAQLGAQLAVQTSVLTEALATLNRVTTAHQYAMEQYAAVASTVVQASAGAAGTITGNVLSSSPLLASNPASSARINLSRIQQRS